MSIELEQIQVDHDQHFDELKNQLHDQILNNVRLAKRESLIFKLIYKTAIAVLLILSVLSGTLGFFSVDVVKTYVVPVINIIFGLLMVIFAVYNFSTRSDKLKKLASKLEKSATKIYNSQNLNDIGKKLNKLHSLLSSLKLRLHRKTIQIEPRKIELNLDDTTYVLSLT